jgi:hypothetical protein
MRLLYDTAVEIENVGKIYKSISWCEEYIEIFCEEITKGKKHVFRLSPAAVAVMVQKYYYDLTDLWKMLADSVRVYLDRILFSTEHIQKFRCFKDSRQRDALLIYQVIPWKFLR